jgi:hypothetical protein
MKRLNPVETGPAKTVTAYSFQRFTDGAARSDYLVHLISNKRQSGQCFAEIFSQSPPPVKRILSQIFHSFFKSHVIKSPIRKSSFQWTQKRLYHLLF